MIPTTSSAGDLSAPSPTCEPPRSLTTTFAPCAASSSASPRPMPRPAPVTIATFPSSSPTGVTSESCVLQCQPYLTRVSQYLSGCSCSQGGRTKGDQVGLSRDEVVGMPTGKSTVVIERGPVTEFAGSVTES